MTNRIKWALLALLGFSAACSTVKNTTKNAEAEPETADSVPAVQPLYGVRVPVAVVEKPETAAPETMAAADSTAVGEASVRDIPNVRVLYGVRLPKESDSTARPVMPVPQTEGETDKQ